MPNPNYVIDCPGCGAQLDAHAGHYDSTPWVCHNCHRGFWVAELKPAALAIYDGREHAWKHGLEAARLREDVDAEREEARARGTSALPEHLGFLAKDHLEMLLRMPLNKEFKKLVKGAM
jgi:hypothetical protein